MSGQIAQDTEKHRTRGVRAETPRAHAIKAALLEDAATDDELAAAFDVTPRTVRRWDLPYIQIGATRYYLLRAAREKFLRHQHGGDPPPPRTRGRPRAIHPEKPTAAT
jgi:hypothetical protein